VPLILVGYHTTNGYKLFEPKTGQVVVSRDVVVDEITNWNWEKKEPEELMSAYFCPHLMFNSGYLIEFVCLKSDLIDNSDN